MTIYNKLVRDRIPEIIQRNGNTCETRELTDDEYVEYLHTKLREEVEEYEQSRDIEELTDVLEVIYAIARHQGMDSARLEQIRLDKRDQRGGFDKKILLISAND
jgi:predicted house-cleaning noncanonical NTP pyrophosphatase (MazG superfamily)